MRGRQPERGGIARSRAAILGADGGVRRTSSSSVRSSTLGSRSDFSRTDWASPEIEFGFGDGPDPQRWAGIAGMAEAWLAFRAVLGEPALRRGRVPRARRRARPRQHALHRSHAGKRARARAGADAPGEPAPDPRREGRKADPLLARRAGARRPRPGGLTAGTTGPRSRRAGGGSGRRRGRCGRASRRRATLPRDARSGPGIDRWRWAAGAGRAAPAAR